jgi:hypothetical protein
MTLPRHEVLSGLRAAMHPFEALVRSLDDGRWNAPTRCDRWTVADVAAHLVTQFVDDQFVSSFHDEASAASDLSGVTAGGGNGVTELAEHGWGPDVLSLDGLDEVPVDGGGGSRVVGDPHEFVLVATRRADPSTFGFGERVNIYRQR